MDITLFAKWQPQSVTLESPSTTTSRPRLRISSTTISSSTNSATRGVITHAMDKNFVAYCGDEPPWD
jgi:hypothetical protein